MTSNDFTSIDVFCALDVGKSTHHGTALLADGRTTFDKPLPNGEPQLRELFTRLKRKGKVLVVVDQPASIGTLAVTIARACGCDVAYLPGLSMRRLADLHPGSGKTDARDAYVIADAARTMPHLLRAIDPDESVRAELTMVLGHDDDLAQDATRTSNRLRGLLTSIHPALERVLGPRLRHPAVLALLQTFGSPTQLAQAGTEQITQVMLQAAPRMRSAHTLADQITTALAEQTVQVPGTASAGEIVSGLAEALAVLLKRREILETRIAALLEAHPLAKVLTLHARGRGQDRSPHPGRGRRRQRVPHRRSPGFLRGTNPHHPSFRDLYPGRRAASRRQQDAQTGPVPGLVRLAEQPRIAGLLRQEALGEQAPQRSPHLPHPPPRQRPARHAQTPHPLPTQARTNSLTKPTDLDRTDRSTPRVPFSCSPIRSNPQAPRGGWTDRSTTGEQAREAPGRHG